MQVVHLNLKIMNELTWHANASQEGQGDEAREVVAEDHSQRTQSEEEDAGHGEVSSAKPVWQESKSKRGHLKNPF